MPTHCRCRRCLDDRDERVTVLGMSVPASGALFIVCETCGNKRCPHASDHRNDCTASNEPGQPGSDY